MLYPFYETSLKTNQKRISKKKKIKQESGPRHKQRIINRISRKAIASMRESTICLSLCSHPELKCLSGFAELKKMPSTDYDIADVDNNNRYNTFIQKVVDSV